jgi:hypothetical protein
MPHLIAVSPALRRYWLEIAARHADAVALVLVKQSGGELSVQAARIIARSLTSVFSVIIDEIGQAMKNDGDLRAVIESLRMQIDVALHHLDVGLARLD